MLDVVIRDGIVIDGTGAPNRRCDVGISGNRVTAMGELGGAEAAEVIEAAGRMVLPGFVDPHSHSDWTVHSNRNAESTIRQGVTTEVVGNCGISNAPVSHFSKETIATRLHSFAAREDRQWNSFAEYLENVESGGTSQNLAFFVGHSTIREAAGVGPRAPTTLQLRQMENFVEEAMDAGAIGMSSGLEYSAGRFASDDEIAALTMVIGRRGGMYASHVRNRDAALLEAIAEFIRAVRGGGVVAGQISHLNVRDRTGAPPQGWQRAVEMMDEARHQGLDIEADTTPFRQGLGLMVAILPEWILSDGYEAAASQLRDADVRRRVRAGCDRYWRFIHNGEWDRVRLQWSPQFPEWGGLRFTEIADATHKDPWDCYFDILSAAGREMGDLAMVGDLFTEQHLAEMVVHPDFSLGVDTTSSAIEAPLCDITRSPLPYRGHIEYLTHHVREMKTLTLEQAVHKMTGKPAQRFGLKDRGVLATGSFADVVVLDFDRLESTSTFETPAVYPTGIDAVFVNGEVVVRGGQHTGARPGRVLRRG